MTTTYRIVNDRYAQSSDPISGWSEFLAMHEASFGEKFIGDYREDTNGVIWTRENGEWERTLEPIR